MLEQKIVQKALETALQAGHQFAEIFAEYKTAFSAGLDNGRLERIRSGVDCGCGFRIINGAKTYYGFVNSLRAADILDLAARISALAAQSGRKTLADFSRKNYPAAPDKKTAAEKIELIRAAEKAARRFSQKICQVTARLGESEQKIFVANTAGVWSEDTRARRRFIVQCVARQGGDLQTGYETAGFSGGWGDFTSDRAADLAETAAARAVLLLSAQKAPAGAMPVVLSGEAGGTMIHEACGHALEADFIYKKTSIFTDTLGTQLFPKCVTIIDDGALAGLYGAAACDDEGTPAKQNILINAGKVNGFMNDRLYAGLLKHPLSGNGRRESYRYAPIPRMTNTYLAAGVDDPAKIIRSVDKGLFVKKLGGGQVDVTNGNFVFEVTEGYLLQDGEIGRPVRGATLVGSGSAVLKSIDMVGNDLRFISGVCGKGQTAPVSDGQPTVRIPSLIVGGQQ
ncbi:protease TldD [Candidatus Termititenax aidoneus]|uniref:Protease TldD n=1 Tax=Termititenax aidoneus TaxID=2218524 RepID=A0A388TBZ2_TERA1|nr:protease TldD [Candidatus Termititenax aidoneus]